MVNIKFWKKKISKKAIEADQEVSQTTALESKTVIIF